MQDVSQTLASWQTQLNQGIKNAAPQATPLNFKATNSRGGITLNWSPVAGSDGYEILKSLNGSFTDDLQIIPVKNSNLSAFFDSTGGTAVKASYRIRTTSGTQQNPQSQRGPESGVVSHTSIDASDTVTVPTTQLDKFTTDKTRAGAAIGNYGAIRQSNIGQTGAASSNTPTGGGTSKSSSTTAFATVSSSTNTQATMIVASGARIVADATSPGVISATHIQGIQVAGTPSNTNSLTFNSSSGVLTYTATAQALAKVTHQFLDSFNATTGAFAQSQPAEADLSVTDITTNNVSSTAHGFAPKAPADATKFMNGAATPAYANVKDSDLAVIDVTTNNATSTAHGFAPKTPSDATKFLNGAATAAYAAVKDSDLAVIDVTTNNVSITAHGFAPKSPNDVTKFLDGTGAYSQPSTFATATLTAATPTVAAGQLGIGTTTAATATAGAATLPAAPVGFLVLNLGGVAVKIAYYAV
ncbi:MAG TPA: hypothetical protein VI386_17955 [Candidatus Sulfotelmatobacter sp.]